MRRRTVFKPIWYPAAHPIWVPYGHHTAQQPAYYQQQRDAPGVFMASGFERSAFRMSMIRSLMLRKLASYSAKSFSSFKIKEALRAPHAGGLEILHRSRTASWDEIRCAASFASGPDIIPWKHSILWPYCLQFLAKDCAMHTSKPCSTKCRVAHAS